MVRRVIRDNPLNIECILAALTIWAQAEISRQIAEVQSLEGLALRLSWDSAVTIENFSSFARISGIICIPAGPIPLLCCDIKVDVDFRYYFEAQECTRLSCFVMRMGDHFCTDLLHRYHEGILTPLGDCIVSDTEQSSSEQIGNS